MGKLTDRPERTIAVHHGRKITKQQTLPPFQMAINLNYNMPLTFSPLSVYEKAPYEKL